MPRRPGHLVATTSSGVYASGYLLYRRNTTLLAQRFDEKTLQLSGEPVAIAEDVGYNPVTFQALFSASNTGVLAYRDAAPGAELVWFNRSGQRLATVGRARRVQRAVHDARRPPARLRAGRLRQREHRHVDDGPGNVGNDAADLCRAGRVLPGVRAE